jgi:hypothetical protein
VTRRPTSRHAKPTAAALVSRIYRHQLAVKSDLESLRSGQAMLSQRLESFRILADHCARLLREKETLMTLLGRQRIERQVASANTYMGLPARGNGCAFSNLHRAGILCAVCGTTPTPEWPDRAL